MGLPFMTEMGRGQTDITVINTTLPSLLQQQHPFQTGE